MTLSREGFHVFSAGSCTEVCLEIYNGIIQMVDYEIRLEVLLGLLVLRPIRPFSSNYLMTVNGI